MNEFVIPVSNALKGFLKHLDANPRTILSSKFGDGKSYFLQKLKENSKVCKKYEFITIYPVNYQVAGNKDVFELLKRDILYQLLLHGMISGNVVITKKEALSWFINKRGCGLLADIVSCVSDVGLVPEDSAKVLAAIKTVKLFKSIKEKFAEIKTEFELFYSSSNGSEDDFIDAFLEKVDSSFVYENDVITKIIQKAIKDYKTRTGKQVVLLIEDMDRIDPAHLFRILNVLSAHMDYCYKYFVKPDSTLIGNKFEVDNIVLVIDFKNLKRIYHHFYGEQTDFKGYISKFLSSTPFYYSLERLRDDYILDKLVEITGYEKRIVKQLISEDILKLARLREIVQSFELEKQIPQKPQVKCGDVNVALDLSALKLMSVMKRLKVPLPEIKEKMMSIRKIDNNAFVQTIYPYIFMVESAPINEPDTRYVVVKEGNEIIQHVVKLNDKTGTASITARMIGPRYDRVNDFSPCLEAMCLLIA